MSQKFCNILVTCGTILTLGSFCRCRKVRCPADLIFSKCPAHLILSEFYTLDYLQCLRASKSTVLRQFKLTGSSSFLQLKRNFLIYLITVIHCAFTICSTNAFVLFFSTELWLISNSFSIRWTFICTNHTLGEAIHYESVHQLPRYYQEK